MNNAPKSPTPPPPPVRDASEYDYVSDWESIIETPDEWDAPDEWINLKIDHGKWEPVGEWDTLAPEPPPPAPKI